LKFCRILFILIILYKSFSVHSEELISDSDYYEKGISHYKNAEFPEAYVVFFNLANKGDPNSQFNVSNMYSSGIGTTQDYKKALKWAWLCALGGEKRCIKKIDLVKEKIDEKSLLDLSTEIPDLLEKKFYDKSDIIYALKLGFWYEKFSPEIDLEQAYIWYSVSVTGGLYKAMKVRNKVSEIIDAETIVKLQNNANDIYNKVKFFPKKNKVIK
tara:strand:- start:29 stop:667 length:639 start_codon:yes stop_codon:yes gene_type:complete